MKRSTIAAGLGALVLAVVASVSTYIVVHRSPPSQPLPTTSELAAKLDTLEDPRLSTDVRADIISGEGPAPRTALNPRGFGPEITVTNNGDCCTIR